MLILSPMHRLHQEQVVDVLWPVLEPSAALNNLYGTLHILRHLLEPGLGPGRVSTFVSLHEGLLELRAPGGLSVDVEAFEVAARLAGNAREPEAYEAALALYTGDLLPGDRYADWVANRRQALRTLHMSLLLELGLLYEQAGDLAGSIRANEQLVAIDPAHEEAHAALMCLYARAGQRSRALRQYQLMTNALRQELDAEPDPHTNALYHAILMGEFRRERDARTAIHLVAVDARRALTRREHQIATLVAGGLTNRQIAIRLGLSVRTADTHVCRILRKLGLSCRDNIARVLHEADAPQHAAAFG